jgi:hypothetical protein
VGEVTVNGKQLEQHLAEEAAREITEVRNADHPYKRPPASGSKFGSNLSHTRSSVGQIVYQSGQKAQKVVIGRTIFPWHAKAPFVPSGMSVLGAIECDDAETEVRCHECGEWYASLFKHIKAHGIDARHYKLKHGVPAGAPLCSPEMSEELRRRAMGVQCMRKSGPGYSPRMASALLKSNEDRRRAANDRADRGLGWSMHPGLANLRGKCRAQLTEKIKTLCAAKGRQPFLTELREAGIRDGDIKRILGITFRDLWYSIGIIPRNNGRPYYPRSVSGIAKREGRSRLTVEQISNFKNAIKRGETLRTAMVSELGFSDSTAKRGRASLPRRVLVELASDGISLGNEVVA